MKTLMILFVSVFYVCATHLFGQVVVDNNNFMEILYRKYDNLVQIASQHDVSTVDLKGDSCTILKKETGYIVRPNVKADFITLQVVDRQTKAVLDSLEFQVFDFPKPWLELNGTQAGSVFREAGKAIVATYGHGWPISCKIKVRRWTLTTSIKRIEGKGTLLTDEAVATIGHLSSGEIFTLEVETENCAGTSERIVGSWTRENEDFHVDKELSFSGSYRVIDKTEQTNALFDYNNPFSLVSLLANNQLNYIHGMDELISDRIMSKDTTLILPSYRYKPMSDSPMINDDPTSENYGEPIIITNLDGSQEYKYPDNVKYYDVTGITRIVVFEDTVQNEDTGERYFGISKLGFAKQYPGSSKYDVVFTLPYQYLAKMDAFKAVVKLSEDDSKTLVNESSFLKKHLHQFAGDYCVADDLAGLDSLIKHYKTTCNFSELMDAYDQKRSFNYLTVMPLAEQYFPSYRTQDWKRDITIGYHNPDIIPFRSANPEDVIQQFTCDFKYGEQTSIPLTDDNGDPITRYDSVLQKMTYVYEPREIYFKWVHNENPIIYVLYDFMYHDSKCSGENNVYPEAIYFAAPNPSEPGMYATLKIDLYQYAIDNPERRYGYNAELHPLIDQHVIANYTQHVPWKMQLEGELNTAKRYQSSLKRDVKQLNRMFYLDGYAKVPFNLLGVTLK
jgi:hypothetical protein